MTNIQQTIYLSNESLDVDWENQYALIVLDQSNNQFEVLDVYTLYGDKHELSSFEVYKTDEHFKELINDRVAFIIETREQTKTDNYEEIHGKDEYTKTIFEPLNAEVWI
jgi:hypothetical protein